MRDKTELLRSHTHPHHSLASSHTRTHGRFLFRKHTQLFCACIDKYVCGCVHALVCTSMSMCVGVYMRWCTHRYCVLSSICMCTFHTLAHMRSVTRANTHGPQCKQNGLTTAIARSSSLLLAAAAPAIASCLFTSAAAAAACLYVCVCVCEREGERERKKERERENG